MIDRFVTWLAQSPEYGVKYLGGIYMRSLSRFMCFIACCHIAALSAGCGSDGEPPTMAPSIPPGATVPELAINRVFAAMPAFNRPVAMKQAPGDPNRWFVAEKQGFIRVFANNVDASAASVFLDISGVVNSAGEGGLLGFAFHPEFPLTPEVYVSYTRSGAPLVSYISRFLSTDDGQTLVAGS